MHKKGVLIVNQKKLNVMVKQKIINNGSDVNNVIEHSFGKFPKTIAITNSIGLSYGLPKAIASDNYVSYLDIALLNLNKLKIIGLNKNQKNN